MMVAFRYDNGASAPSTTRARCRRCFAGLRLSKLFGRDGIITFESNGGFVLVRGDGTAAAASFPGLRDIRGLPGDVP